ncbi:TPA: hypothetical protein SAY52_005415 [Burkholderia cenocepacia]|uniref:hypothetical protein n=1 Tax=unclassified Burkholderia TaxID=2613784 RepID=UPI001588E906|nr:MULTISPECIES: hypothetical protein [unclassified Burkholderia]HEF5874736.1 hypothetical protein [Burkholderia cenocepacia]
MRELKHTEHAAVPGGLTTSDVNDWISNILRPKPKEPYVKPNPSESANPDAVNTLGKVVVAVAMTTLAVAATLFRAGSTRFF